MDTRSDSQIRLFDSVQSEGEARQTVKFLAELNYRNAGDVVEAVRSALSPGSGSISIDLAEVPLIDSSGLRSLLQAKKMCEDAQTCFEIDAISDAAARVIAMSGLSEAFGLDGTPSALRRDGEAQLRPTIPVCPAAADTVRGDDGQRWEIYEHVAESHPSVIAELREKATDAARAAGATGDALCDIQIAVGEALTNAYRHGSPQPGKDKIGMCCMTCPRAVVIEIWDEGHPFDYTNCTEPDPQQMRDHGMGIFLMRQAMDKVEFQCNCPGTRVRMVKWLR
jgi:anti-anti-sigma factor